jgi:riboflavin kinase/FMN adenylyltransferase
MREIQWVNRQNLGIFNNMKSFAGLSDILQPLQGSVLTIGNFDGLHAGHRMLVSRLKGQAKALQLPAVVLTFEPHPLEVLAPEVAHERLFEKTDLAEQLRAENIEYLIIEPFTREFSKRTADDFLSQVVLPKLNVRSLVVGHDFGFGARRSGTVEMLREFCTARGIALEVVPPVEVNGATVSSSIIRQLIRVGKVAEVVELLERPYHVSGRVVAGQGRGRTIGIPTANLELTSGFLPAPGVYVTSVWWQSEWQPAVSNIGCNPTFQAKGAGPQWSFETHIFDQSAEIYGQPLQVRFHKRLRDEKRFESPQALVAQIQQDMFHARQFFHKRS